MSAPAVAPRPQRAGTVTGQDCHCPASQSRGVLTPGHRVLGLGLLSRNVLSALLVTLLGIPTDPLPNPFRVGHVSHRGC